MVDRGGKTKCIEFKYLVQFPPSLSQDEYRRNMNLKMDFQLRKDLTKDGLPESRSKRLVVYMWIDTI
ncbi:hypothetical protein H5410_017260 [Solanum commersonii]|uniref:Uncharacterized protein n=1 Tax=Solanum commersonii TaxID=4109 RepID=A0A9J5ZZU4_SOLCO|nr:hypothetical protein H5410_017260 [Solanum commersonii]